MQTVLPFSYKTFQNLCCPFLMLLLICHNIEDHVDIGEPAIGVDALRVKGTFDAARDFFVFIAKFGFQKTDIRYPNNTQGVIYGNITIAPNNPSALDEVSENETEHDDNLGKKRIFSTNY